MFTKIGTMKSFIKLNAEDRISRIRETGTGLVHEVNRVALINEEVVVVLAIGGLAVV